MDTINSLCTRLEHAFNVINKHSLLTEVRLQELQQDTKAITKERAKDCNVTFRVRMSKNGHDKFYFSVKRPTSKAYRVNIDFKGEYPDPLNDNVRVSCNCGAWKWWGSDYNSREYDYNLRRMSDGSPPDIRDPKRQNFICKHVYAASKVLVSYLRSLKK